MDSLVHNKNFLFYYFLCSLLFVFFMYLFVTGFLNFNFLKNDLSFSKNLIFEESVGDSKSILDSYNILDYDMVQNPVIVSQYPNYPSGCEVSSLYILLHYYSIDVSIDELISNMDYGSVPYYSNGVIYGGNPEEEFIGNPYSFNGYGTYNNALAKLANKYKPGIISRSGVDFSEVLKIVDMNKPVIVWSTMNLSYGFISEYWQTVDGIPVYWISGEHALVVIGHTDKEVIVSDPYVGYVRYFDRNIFEDRYNFMGKRALYY